jgi:hypothetical protein
VSSRARFLAPLAIPLVIAGLAAWATAGDDHAAQTKKVLEELEGKKAGPALAGASHGDGGLAGDAGPPKPKRDVLALATHPMTEARRALARAEELRKLGDPARAELAEDAALEWALAARETVRAVEIEDDGNEQATLATDTETKAARVRKLLNEALERRKKLEDQLDALDKELEARALDAGSADAAKKPAAKKAKP